MNESPLAWAYLGDAVWELYVRHRVMEVGPPKPQELHQITVGWVSASAQAHALERVWDKLSSNEQELVKRGRNQKAPRGPRGVDVATYRWATGLEALLGYLYLQDQGRLNQVLETLAQAIEEETE